MDDEADAMLKEAECLMASLSPPDLAIGRAPSGPKKQLKAIIERNNKRLQNVNEKKRKAEQEEKRQREESVEEEEEEEGASQGLTAEMKAHADAFYVQQDAAKDKAGMAEEPQSHQCGVSWQPSSSPLPCPDLSFLPNVIGGALELGSKEEATEVWQALLSQAAVATLLDSNPEKDEASARRAASSSQKDRASTSTSSSAVFAALFDTLAYSSDAALASAALRELTTLLHAEASRRLTGPSSGVDLKKVASALTTLGVVSNPISLTPSLPPPHTSLSLNASLPSPHPSLSLNASASRLSNLRLVLRILTAVTKVTPARDIPQDLTARIEAMLMDLYPLILDPEASSYCLVELTEAIDALVSLISASPCWSQVVTRVSGSMSRAGPTHRAALKLASWFGAKRRPAASREIGRVTCLLIIKALVSSTSSSSAGMIQLPLADDGAQELKRLLGEATRAEISTFLSQFELDSKIRVKASTSKDGGGGKIDYWMLQTVVEAANTVVWCGGEGGDVAQWFVKWVGVLDEKLGRSPLSAGVRKLLSSIKNCYS